MSSSGTCGGIGFLWLKPLKQLTMAKSKPDNPPQVAVALLDTHTWMREAIGDWLEQRAGYRMVWKGGTHAELEKALDEGLKVTLVVVALAKGEEAGFAALEWVWKERPKLFRAAYVHRHDEALILQAYRHGAQAVLHDTVEADAVRCALNTAAVGGVFHSVESQQLFLSNPDGLTERERIREKRRQEITPKLWGVLMAVGKYPGHSATMLGKHLGITSRTVEDHMENLYGIFGVKSKTALVVRAIQIGLIPL